MSPGYLERFLAFAFLNLSQTLLGQEKHFKRNLARLHDTRATISKSHLAIVLCPTWRTILSLQAPARDRYSNLVLDAYARQKYEHTVEAQKGERIIERHIRTELNCAPSIERSHRVILLNSFFFFFLFSLLHLFFSLAADGFTGRFWILCFTIQVCYSRCCCCFVELTPFLSCRKTPAADLPERLLHYVLVFIALQHLRMSCFWITAIFEN